MFDKQKIIDSVNSTWSKDLIIRYLYVALAPGFQRDVNFFGAILSVQYDMYKRGVVGSDVHVTCWTISQYYQTLYNSFGIDCEIVTTNNYRVPHYALIVYGDNAKYFIDPLKDLEFNQYRCKTKYFGILPVSRTQNNLELYPNLTVLSEDYLMEMDNYLGLQKNGIYTDDIIFELRKSVFDNDDLDSLLRLIGETRESVGLVNISGDFIDDNVIQAKIELINRYLINIGNVPGEMERFLIYQYLKNNIFSELEGSMIRITSDLSIMFRTQYGIQIYKEERDSNGIYSLNRKR